MMIIDSQIHAYEANTSKRPWATTPDSPPSATGDEHVVAMDKLGVDGAIFVSSFAMYRYDSSYAVEVQKKHPGRFALVKPVDADDPNVEDVIAEWKRTPGTVGIRVRLQEKERKHDEPGLDRILRAAVKHDFPVNFLCWGNIDVGTQVIDRHPDTRFVVDHLGMLQPRTPATRAAEPWADLPKVVDLAKRKNAVIKISGACTLSKESYPFPDIWDPLARIFDAWGIERCLWGTDWTRASPVVNFENAVKPFRYTDRLSASERAMLMGGACEKTYRWAPKKA